VIRATAAYKSGHEARNPFSDSVAKLSTLEAYRRAKGLCFKCGEQWSKEHTCPASIQLHIVEELWEFLGTDALGVEDEATLTSEATDIVCAISVQALTNQVEESVGSPSVL
jgi:hypothetical protein